MKLYDLFFNTLATTNDFELAIKAVENEILKRKTCLPLQNSDTYQDLKINLEKIIKLENKHKLITKIKIPKRNKNNLNK